jgi:hypothetical protein
VNRHVGKQFLKLFSLERSALEKKLIFMLRVVSLQSVNCLLENQAERGLPIRLRAERGRKTRAGTAWRRQYLGATLEEQKLESETQLETCFSTWGQ